MIKKDTITMSIKELKRVQIVNKALEKRIKQKEAAKILDLSERQIRRLVKSLKKDGEKGLIHGLRGKESKRKISNAKKDLIIDKYLETYKGFGPTLAQEKLEERDKIKISRESLRQMLLGSGLWEISRKSKKHRHWRERKKYYGEMSQIDGSRHKWFEERGPEVSLMAQIDDAKSEVYAEFHEYEGTIPAMQSFKGYLKEHGIPMSVYVDKHSTYKSQHEATVEEQLSGIKAKSQYGRALEEIGVEVIYAHSPQAKGRIERLFKTFQDRLIKEMRLEGISSIKEGNRFLKEYLPRFNKKFSVEPAGKENLHRKVTSWKEINRALTVRTESFVRNDYTIIHGTSLYQLRTALSLRGKKVTAIEQLNGKLKVEYKGKMIDFSKIETRPQKISETIKPVDRIMIRRRYMPSINHPWRAAVVVK